MTPASSSGPLFTAVLSGRSILVDGALKREIDAARSSVSGPRRSNLRLGDLMRIGHRGRRRPSSCGTAVGPRPFPRPDAARGQPIPLTEIAPLIERFFETDRAASTRRAMRAAILGGGITGCVLAADAGVSGGRLDVTLLERGDTPRRAAPRRRAGPYVFDIGAFVVRRRSLDLLASFPGVRSLFLRAPSRYGSIRDDVGSSTTIPARCRASGAVRIVLPGADAARDRLVSKARRFRKSDLRSFVEYYMGPSLYRASGSAALHRAPVSRARRGDRRRSSPRSGWRLSPTPAASGGTWPRLAGDLAHGRRPGEFARPSTADHVWVRPRAGFEAVYDRHLDQRSASAAWSSA